MVLVLNMVRVFSAEVDRQGFEDLRCCPVYHDVGQFPVNFTLAVPRLELLDRPRVFAIVDGRKFKFAIAGFGVEFELTQPDVLGTRGSDIDKILTPSAVRLESHLVPLIQLLLPLVQSPLTTSRWKHEGVCRGAALALYPPIE